MKRVTAETRLPVLRSSCGGLKMSKPLSVLSKSAFLILFAFSALPVFAQHGGGGHGGGGFHGGGGGGFHGGGGGSFHGGGGGGFHSGGGFRGGSVPAAGYGAPRASAPPSYRSGGGFASRPGNTYAGGNQRFGTSAPRSSGTGNGQWHSFAPPSAERGTSGGAQPAGPSAGGWRVASGNHSASAPGAVRSFSGQGGEVWENSGSRNVVSRSQSLSTMHSSLSGSLFARSGAGSSSALSGRAHFTGGSPLLGNRALSGGVNTASSFQHIRGFGFNRFGYPGGWRGGCWNCGFGLGWRGGFGWGGWGLGWGWPGLGFWGWNPFWIDPWWGWGAGYGYYGYPTNNYIYNDYYPDSGNYGPDDNSAPPPPADDQYDEENQGSPSGNWVMPNGPSPSNTPNSPSLNVPVLIYLKNGAVLTVRDYWMIDGEMHYITMSGTQKSVDLEQVDLARSNSENAKSGVRFIFKSEPSAPTPDEVPVQPPAQPDSSRPGLSVQPEART